MRLTLRNEELLLVIELLVCGFSSWHPNLNLRRLTFFVIMEFFQEDQQFVPVPSQDTSDLSRLVRIGNEYLAVSDVADKVHRQTSLSPFLIVLYSP